MSQVSKTPDFGQRVAANRSQRKPSQLWRARPAGLDPSYVSRIENGKVQPSVPMAQKLAVALGTLDPTPKSGSRFGVIFLS